MKQLYTTVQMKWMLEIKDISRTTYNNVKILHHIVSIRGTDINNMKQLN